MTGRRLRRLDMRGLIAIHQELLARYGGHSREVDLAMLELSIVRSELVARGPHLKSRARLAAEYGWRVLLNCPFAVGNKPMALVAMVTYLGMNGLAWKCSEVEETATVLRAAAGDMQRKEWDAWVVGNVGKRTPKLGR